MNANLSSLSLSYPHTLHIHSVVYYLLVVKLNAKFIRFQKKYIPKDKSIEREGV